MTEHEPADHRGALGDLYEDLQLYREADFDQEQAVRAAMISARRTCARLALAAPTPDQEQAAMVLVGALWAWQEAQVAEEEKRVDPPPPSEKWDVHGICLACEGRGRDSEDLFCHSCGGQGDRCSYELAIKERKTREDGKQSYRPRALKPPLSCSSSSPSWCR